VHDGAPLAERYRAAIEVLAAIHSAPRPAVLAGPAGEHRLLALNADALGADVDLFVDWFVPHANRAPLAEPARAEFAALWAGLFARVAGGEESWVLFDVQSANLLWLGERDGLRRVGLLDFQDMFHGPPAYDVASLCQDARVTVPPPLEAELTRHYAALRRAAAPQFDETAFRAAYAILATARAMKNLGVFARQADHLGEARYLGHIPRVRQYLVRNFAHPVLSALAVWYDRHVSPDRI
jgi:aminoglycoside/choline kinase family phosphotransferase